MTSGMNGPPDQQRTQGPVNQGPRSCQQKDVGQMAGSGGPRHDALEEGDAMKTMDAHSRSALERMPSN
jgi:hypothetical protein